MSVMNQPAPVRLPGSDALQVRVSTQYPSTRIGWRLNARVDILWQRRDHQGLRMLGKNPLLIFFWSQAEFLRLAG